MTTRLFVSVALSLIACSAFAQGAKPLTKCAPDAVPAGRVCIDKYEASVWRVADALGVNRGLVKRIRAGQVVSAAELTAAGATQLGLFDDTYAPCGDNGQNCTDDIFAVSIRGVVPSQYATWFQAVAACENARKGLPSNAEWQAAVIGTPNPGVDNGTTTCTTLSTLSPTGSRSGCVSARGAFDMVGNLDEWTADWVPRSTTCGSWKVTLNPTGDYQCLAGAATSGEPGALVRGGYWGDGAFGAGPLAVNGSFPPSDTDVRIGFRCAR